LHFLLGLSVSATKVWFSLQPYGTGPGKEFSGSMNRQAAVLKETTMPARAPAAKHF